MAAIKTLMGGAIANRKTFMGKSTVVGLTNAVSLLHCNGTNGDSTVVDESGKSWTAWGTAQLSTSSPKFGTAAFLFDADNNSDYLTTSNHADFRPSGSWGMSCWVKIASDANFHTIFCSGGYNAGFYYGISVLINGADGFRCWMYGGNSFADVRVQDTGTVIKDNTWHHIEVNFDSAGSTLYLYVDGTQVQSGYVGFNAQWYSTNIVEVGRFNPDGSDSFRLEGRVDEFVFVNGSRIHTAGFTPPTSEYAYGSPNIKTIMGVNLT